MTKGPRIKQFEDTPWKSRGACLGVGPGVFFPTTKKEADAAPAKAICRRCEVRLECLEYSLDLPTDQRDHGVWGGVTANERDRIRRARR